MSETLRLTIATPSEMLIDCRDVVAFRGEDMTGSFGILPGHADFLTVLAPCVVRWRTTDGRRRFCAIGSGVLRVIDGNYVGIACREGELGDALDTLEAHIRAAREARADAARKARVEQTRLNARAIRQILMYLRPRKPEMPGRTDGTSVGDGHAQ
ncbi:F0F1 ATP synthase subunit epsilon [Trinickia soli]|uniref:F0F1 ATP synthase subunit epsilon n=1 Tax=Trinickia soli TaxID=380675 RepID=UPI00125C59CA|nr:F0F1 ATP synthase subunit epsilon [Paraburkholderia sp. T12-10]